MTYVKKKRGLYYERGGDGVGWISRTRTEYLALLAAGAKVWSEDDAAFKRGLDAELDAHLTAQYQEQFG